MHARDGLTFRPSSRLGDSANEHLQIRRSGYSAWGYVLLADVLTPNIGYAGEQVFFSRKAIGWALRDYAWTSPDWVRAYVADHPDLSGLSRREALKHLSQPTDAPTT